MGGVGQEVKRLREERGWIQAKLAVEAGMAPSAVNQIENGKRSPSAGSLNKMAEALGVEVADLFPKVVAQPSLQQSFSGLLEEERRIQHLRVWRRLATALGNQWEDRYFKPEAIESIPVASEINSLALTLTLTITENVVRKEFPDPNNITGGVATEIGLVGEALDRLTDIVERYWEKVAPMIARQQWTAEAEQFKAQRAERRAALHIFSGRRAAG